MPQTAMKIRDTLQRDPIEVPLANSGQARLTGGDPKKAERELRAELETFVCRGKFADALQRILERYLTNLDASRQDAVWVSGFFGSGKSHLLKMLAHLWVDTSFDDGATARGLVADRLPSEVGAALRELTVRSRRLGRPPVAAAGSLLGGNVGHVRLSVLSVVLKSCGYPEQYPQARFCFWLRDNGHLGAVRGAVESAGRDWKKELNNLYVSPVIAKSLIEADPDFAADVRAARQLLVGQYPQPRTDITTDEFVAAAKQALAPDGELPPTILVLDEVQQYINEAQDRAAIITELAEAVQTRFDSRVLLVASGQSALSAGTTALRWLTDRFRIAVQLTDAEVEEVTREVLLRKKPSAVPAIEAMFESCTGEVTRQLGGTRLAPRPEDVERRAGDYPLLRTRRRFWEECFRTADPSGTQSQLRSQLRILHDSLREVAEEPLGKVIPASDLFHALAGDLVGADILLNEIATRIAKLQDGTAEGERLADLCGLVFLIGKLPRQDSVDTGVRATAAMLADLLVGDIRGQSGEFRHVVGQELERLVQDGVLMKAEGEYRIQTTEGADWEREFREHRTAFAQSPVDVSARRAELLRAAVQEIVAKVRPTHGEAKIRRRTELLVDAEADAPSGGAVGIWLRDEWEASWKQARDEARRRGMDDHVLHVHLPKKSAEELRRHIENAEAAQRVLEGRGSPASREGQEARSSMNSRMESAEASRDGIVREMIRGARVMLGGGMEVFGDNLAAKLRNGAETALARLFPRFADADHRAWGPALKRAREGSGEPFRVVGWEERVSAHPVSKRIMEAVRAGAKGSKVRRVLEAAPYGWPRDAVDAALVALHRDGHLRAVRNGRLLITAQLDQTAIAGTVFRPEEVRLAPRERVAVRGLFSVLKVNVKSGREGEGAAEFLRRLRGLAERAGGDPPLPAVPDAGFVRDLAGMAGNAQLAAILQSDKEIRAAIKEWKRLGDRAGKRRGVWELAAALCRHAQGELDVADEVGPELEAVEAQRSLLDGADHASPCAAKLAGALRGELAARHGALGEAVAGAAARLAKDATWRKLEASAQGAILARVGLGPPVPLRVETDAAVRRELDERSLASWRSEIDAVSARVAKALEEAAKEVEMNVNYVDVRLGTLSDDADVQRWVAEHRQKLTEAVRKGPVIVR